MAKLSLNELLQQRAALEKQIAETQSAERAEAIAQVRALMSQYGLSLADLGSKSTAAPRRRGSGSGAKVAAKYRNPQTNETWSGRGLKPKWLRAAIESGRSLGDFAI